MKKRTILTAIPFTLVMGVILSVPTAAVLQRVSDVTTTNQTSPAIIDNTPTQASDIAPQSSNSGAVSSQPTTAGASITSDVSTTDTINSDTSQASPAVTPTPVSPDATLNYTPLSDTPTDGSSNTNTTSQTVGF